MTTVMTRQVVAMTDVRRVLATPGGRATTAAAVVSSIGGAAVAGAAWWALVIMAVVAVVAIASACVLRCRELAVRESIDKQLSQADPQLVRAWAQLERSRCSLLGSEVDTPGRAADS